MLRKVSQRTANAQRCCRSRVPRSSPRQPIIFFFLSFLYKVSAVQTIDVQPAVIVRSTHLNMFPSLLSGGTKQAGKDDIQSLPEEERARIFDKARASVISDYLLARLKLVDG